MDDKSPTDNSVIHVPLSGDSIREHVVFQAAPEKKKRHTADAYDYEDPFIEADEEQRYEEAECRVENFFCLAGEEAPEGPARDRDRSKRAKREERSQEKKEEKERHGARKEKREATRRKIIAEEADALSGMKALAEPEIEKEIEKVCLYEVVATPGVKEEEVADKLVEAVDQSMVSRAFVESRVAAYMSHSHLRSKASELAGASQQLLGKVKESIDFNIKEQIGSKELGEEELSFNFDDAFYDAMCTYTENEYLVFYINLYLAGKKRVLEFTVKKNIFQKLQELFPSNYKIAGTLGKKITSYMMKKWARGGKHAEDLRESGDTDAGEKGPADSVDPVDLDALHLSGAEDQ